MLAREWFLPPGLHVVESVTRVTYSTGRSTYPAPEGRLWKGPETTFATQHKFTVSRGAIGRLPESTPKASSAVQEVTCVTLPFASVRFSWNITLRRRREDWI